MQRKQFTPEGKTEIAKLLVNLTLIAYIFRVGMTDTNFQLPFMEQLTHIQ